MNDVLGITCHPLRLRPERNRPAGRRWQMLLPSVPVGRPAASVATPAGRAPPAAAAPAATQSDQNRDVRQLKSLLGDNKRMLMMRQIMSLDMRKIITIHKAELYFTFHAARMDYGPAASFLV